MSAKKKKNDLGPFVSVAFPKTSYPAFLVKSSQEHVDNRGVTWVEVQYSTHPKREWVELSRIVRATDLGTGCRQRRTPQRLTMQAPPPQQDDAEKLTKKKPAAAKKQPCKKKKKLSIKKIPKRKSVVKAPPAITAATAPPASPPAATAVPATTNNHAAGTTSTSSSASTTNNKQTLVYDITGAVVEDPSNPAYCVSDCPGCRAEGLLGRRRPILGGTVTTVMPKKADDKNDDDDDDDETAVKVLRIVGESDMISLRRHPQYGDLCRAFPRMLQMASIITARDGTTMCHDHTEYWPESRIVPGVPYYMPHNDDDDDKSFDFNDDHYDFGVDASVLDEEEENQEPRPAPAAAKAADKKSHDHDEPKEKEEDGKPKSTTATPAPALKDHNA